jgi:hypothetical protein
MKSFVPAIAAALAISGCSAQQQPAAENSQSPAAQRPSEAESEAYMRKAEEDWAALAVRKVPGLMQRIIADDYVGVSSKGDVRDKAKQVATSVSSGPTSGCGVTANGRSWRRRIRCCRRRSRCLCRSWIVSTR